jgi:pyrroloquinoline quinone biosynthesis protein B
MRWKLFLPLALLALSIAAFAAESTGVARAAFASDTGPRVVVLGTVQDGGMPQAGCSCSHCTAARREPSLRRHVASLALDFPRSGHTYMLDATPDLAEQIEVVHGFRRHPEGRVDRAPFDGVLLTHAHMGHYLGLAFFGFESMNTQGLATYVSPRMAAYLRANGPWSQLVRLNNLTLHEIEIGKPFSLEEGVTVTALPVPHRDEYTDTLGFRLQGPRKTLFYVPDTDAWSTWKAPATEVLSDVDYALVDGTFYSPDELPDRDVTKIKHPLITRTLDLLQPLVREGKLHVWFTHLNHSNPALDPGSEARRAIEARGFHVLEEKDELPL